MKVLWLTGWYPNKINKTNGDFIQRHAQAVSLFCDVSVIHVEKDVNELLDKKIYIQHNQNENLNETIVLFKPNKTPIAGKFLSLLNYKRLFKQQVKKYIDENGLPDIVHVQVAMKAGIIALWLKKKFGVPYVVTDQWTMYNSTADDAYENRNFLFKKITKQIFSNASLFISASENMTGIIARKIAEVPFKVAYNVVDTNHFFYKENITDQTFTFVHVSTLKEQKNPKAIIDAFIAFNEAFPNSRMLIIGDVPKEINEYYQQKRLPKQVIEFAGFIPYEKSGIMVQQCNAFILFSTRETMPCVVLEALCCGLPVITSNAGGVAEVINENNGIVVYDYTIQALINAMEKLYKNYHQYNRKDISAKAMEMFSYQTIGHQIKTIYEGILYE